MTTHVSMKLRAWTGSSLRRALRYRGMLVLVVWQAPIQPVIRPNGSFGLMIGGGTDEHAELSCEGDLLRSERVKYNVAAVQADYNITPQVRVDAVGGIARSDWGSHEGAFGTAVLRADWKYFGAGGGIAVTPSLDLYTEETVVWPSVYLRGGSAEGFHARVDVFPPTALLGQQIARLGIGFNAIHRDRPSGFFGVAGLGSEDGATGVAGELSAPLSDRFALRVEGHYAPGHGHTIAGIAAGGRFMLGGATTPGLPAN